MVISVWAIRFGWSPEIIKTLTGAQFKRELIRNLDVTQSTQHIGGVHSTSGNYRLESVLSYGRSNIKDGTSSRRQD